jgi:lactate dehydrogenase-like 2-hydroxyacid dehydrogenase
VVIGAQRYEGPLYRALAGNASSGGALIARFGVGHDGVDKRLARELGITVTNTPGTLDVSVAEHTLWLIGCFSRHVASGHGRFVAGAWSGTTGTELHGRTLGLIGCGPIARRVAAIAGLGFGMRVIACGRRPRAALEAACGPLAALGISDYAQDIDAVLPVAEIVSLHLPATPETRRLFADARFARMRPGSLFINTSRGALVDEAALHRALSAGPLAGAALDVFAQEPYQPGDPALDLRRLSNVVLTPHIGSNTIEANGRMAAACVANARAFLAGRAADLTRVD